jgi:hypothetical protein
VSTAKLLYLAAAEAVDLEASPFGAVMLVVLATSVLVLQAQRSGSPAGPATADRPPATP